MESVYTTTEEFGITYCESHPGGSMPYLHTHNTYEIYYLHEGVRNYIINNKVYELHEGCIALIPPNVFHKTTGDKYKRTLLYFSRSFLEISFKGKLINNLISCFSSPVIDICEKDRKKIESLCIQMSENEFQCGYDERPLLLAELLTLLNKYKQDTKYEPTDASSRLLSNILDYISRNFKTIETLDEIAQSFFITKFHLCRIFKESTGMSVFRYINTLKVQQASTMLSETSNSITEISSECGFNSQVYFCKIFRNIIGLTPSEYRKKFRKK